MNCITVVYIRKYLMQRGLISDEKKSDKGAKEKDLKDLLKIADAIIID